MCVSTVQEYKISGLQWANGTYPGFSVFSESFQVLYPPWGQTFHSAA